MVVGLISGQEFEPTQEYLLNRTLHDLQSDDSLVGTEKIYRDYSLLPDAKEFNEWLSQEASDTYSQDDIEQITSSHYYKELGPWVPKAFFLNATPGPWKPEYVSRCCGKAEMKAKDRWLTPADVAHIILNPPGGPYFPKQHKYKMPCVVHGDTAGFAPQIIPPGSDFYRTVRPTTIFELGVLTPRFVYGARKFVTAEQMIHALGISFQNKMGFPEMPHFDTHFNHANHFAMALGELKSIVPENHALAWLMLAGWRSKNTRNLYSRFPAVSYLVEKSTASEVYGYLEVGVANINEVVKFIKAGLDKETVMAYYASNVTKISVMKRMTKAGIDTNVMTGLFRGEL